MINVKAVRARLWHALSPSTANAVNTTVATLQQFLVGGSLSAQQIETLARHFGIKEGAT